MGSVDPKESLLDLDDPTCDAETPTVKPAILDPHVRARAMTLLDADATEEARLASVLIDSIAPPACEDPNGAAAIRARLAPMTRVPFLEKSITELGASLGEPKNAYVLGFVDGVLPLETIVEVTGLPELDTLRILEHFIAEGAVSFRTRE